MTFPTSFRSRLRSQLKAAPVRRAPELARRRAAALIAQIRELRPAEAAAAWRARLGAPPIWRPVGASVLLHIVALAALVLLHRATFRAIEPPAFEVALTPSDPDARVGPQAGIRWESEAERSAIMALLDARRSAALVNEIVITPGRSPRAPSRPSLASRTPPPNPPPPARAAPADPHPPDPPPPAATPATAQAAAPPIPEAVSTPLPRPALEPAPSPRPAELAAAFAPVHQPAPAPPAPSAEAPVVPPSRPVEPPAEPPAAPPATAQAATPASPAPPVDRGEKGYLQAVFERLRPIRDYPELAKYHTSGRMQLAITVGRDGTVLSAQVRHSSGYGFLDRAGLDLVHRASPLPALPISFTTDSYTFEVPISFRYD